MKKPGAIGDRIRSARLAKGLTQAELGERVGLSQRMITHYEVRAVSLAPALLVRFAHTLEVPVEQLLGEKTRPVPPSAEADSVHLVRRLKKLQQLQPNDRKTVLKMIDLLAEQASKRKAS